MGTISYLFTCFILLVPIIRDIHFYLTHRLLHTKFFYKIAHKVHHHNVNPGPWSGLAMHPVEHVIYFSGILIHWIIPSHPLIALWHIFHAGIAPHAGHSGFDKIVLKMECIYIQELISIICIINTLNVIIVETPLIT